MVDDRLWVVTDGAKLQILDPATGELVGKKALGTVMRSTPIYADGKVYLCTNTGIWYALKPKPDGADVCRSCGSARQIRTTARRSSRTAGSICRLPKRSTALAPRESKPSADPLPTPEQEPPVRPTRSRRRCSSRPTTPPWRRKGRRSSRARLFNARGQFLRIATPEEAKFTVDGPGAVAADGTYTASKRDGHIGLAGDLHRRRADGQGARPPRAAAAVAVRLREGEGHAAQLDRRPHSVRASRISTASKVAKKKDVLPTPADPNNKLGTRSQLFMGPGDMTDYTIQADFRLTEKNGRLPDCGVIDSGYTLALRSGDKRLRLYSWLAARPPDGGRGGVQPAARRLVPDEAPGEAGRRHRPT